MRSTTGSATCSLACALAAVGALASSAAAAQATDAPPPPSQADAGGAEHADATSADVVVIGDRRSAVSDVAPLATLDAGAIAASGATSIGELLRSIKGLTQSADGSDPIFLLNAQRVSGYDEIGSLPPEAIDKVEVLPEPEALKFGYPPTRRVLNFITKRRFRQVAIAATGGTTTRGGAANANTKLDLTRLHDDSRLTLGIEVSHADALAQSARDVLPDPDILFDAVGNVTGVDGGEIDPALSAAAGRPVTVAAVPDAPADRHALAGYLAGAGQPRLFDLGPLRTLAPAKDGLKTTGVWSDRLGGSLAASVSLSAERQRERNLGGPASAVLAVPAGNPFSPFAGPVLLYRYLTEADPLRQRQTTTTLHAGGLLRGAVAGWQWDASAAFDQKLQSGLSDTAIDVAPANAAIAAGTDPFAPLAPALVSPLLTDHARLRTRTIGGKTVVTGSPLRLPAGKTTLTATVEVERADARSRTRGPDASAFDFGRNRVEGAVAIDVPLTSRREGVLAAVGDLSVNASATLRRVGGSGTLHDATLGTTWSPTAAVQLLATYKASEAAPALEALASPVVQVANVPLFDFGTGTTALVTLTTGGNPDLLPEHRRVTSLGVTVKPFAGREWRIGATYETTTIRNQTATVYALTPFNEAALPDLFQRDADGRLVAVGYRPTNIDRERQRTLNVTINTYGQLGHPPAPGATGTPPQRASYYGGIGPSIRFADRLRLRPGSPELDLLDGGSITGGGSARLFGYLYGGVNYLGNGLNFDGYCSGSNRVLGGTPEADIRFATLCKLNASASLSIHHFFPHQAWTSHLGLKLAVDNLTDARQRVRDASGAVPTRFQRDLLDPVGRTISLTLRKLF